MSVRRHQRYAAASAVYSGTKGAVDAITGVLARETRAGGKFA